MNIPLFIAACLTLLAFAAHLFAGTRETAALAPPPDDAPRTKHWVQAMCVFQMVSVVCGCSRFRKVIFGR
ncbi:hypothetical protein, partial [Sulfitobacter geojensis]|uniref:hypothetical protein n=1 Tax=Sulfitobacter geojensis TaxID=1342299 RepID=UPI001F17A3BB